MNPLQSLMNPFDKSVIKAVPPDLYPMNAKLNSPLLNILPNQLSPIFLPDQRWQNCHFDDDQSHNAHVRNQLVPLGLRILDHRQKQPDEENALELRQINKTMPTNSKLAVNDRKMNVHVNSSSSK